MTAKHTIWDSTLTSFRERVARAEQPTTGVSVAVVSATLGASLLQMVLELMAKRSSFAGDADHLSRLRGAAREASQQMVLHGDADIAAHLGYREACRTKADPAEIAQCQRAMIDVPLRAARGSLAALHLCAEAAKIVSGPITADLAMAAILLESAVRSLLGCVAENLRRLPDEQVAVESASMEREAGHLLKAVVRGPAE